MTVEGTVTLGASVAGVMMVNHYNPVLATLVAALAGTVAGAITGVLATKCRINALLSGILVMTGLYSVNLHVMGKSNVPLLEATTLSTYAEP
jgi:putative ABC transport system permease protein